MWTIHVYTQQRPQHSIMIQVYIKNGAIMYKWLPMKYMSIQIHNFHKSYEISRFVQINQWKLVIQKTTTKSTYIHKNNNINSLITILCLVTFFHYNALYCTFHVAIKAVICNFIGWSPCMECKTDVVGFPLVSPW